MRPTRRSLALVPALVPALVALAAMGAVPSAALFAQATTRSAAPARPAAARPAPAPPVATTAATSAFSQLRWRMVGPARGGRVTTVTGVDQEPHTFYFGSTGGGVWKTTDAGANWSNITDGQITVGSMGDIDVANSDPNVIYAGTGSDGLSLQRLDRQGRLEVGRCGEDVEARRAQGRRQHRRVRVHPTNPNVAIVAAIGDPFRPTNARGIYRTTDGGATWQRTLYVSDSTGAVDVEFNAGDPNGAVRRDVARRAQAVDDHLGRDGRRHLQEHGWRRHLGALTNGLPNGLVGKANIAVSRANPQRVYVLIEAKPGMGLYRSDDGGTSFALASNNPQLSTRSFYYTTITADPTNADVVYAGAEGYFKSTDGGRTFAGMRTPHGDNHDLWVNPTNGQILIQSNDGGANVSLNGGRTWSSQYNQPTAEIYQVYVDNQFPYRIYGAQQDNSTLILPSLPVTSGGLDDPVQGWQTGPGCETGPILPHPTNPDTVYGSCKGQYSRMSMRTGQEKHYWIGAQSLYGNAMKDMIFASSASRRWSTRRTTRHAVLRLAVRAPHARRGRDVGGDLP
jgi:photosystem II stability/assembly factor-like uncharacterized protein